MDKSIVSPFFYDSQCIWAYIAKFWFFVTASQACASRDVG